MTPYRMHGWWTPFMMDTPQAHLPILLASRQLDLLQHHLRGWTVSADAPRDEYLAIAAFPILRMSSYSPTTVMNANLDTPRPPRALRPLRLVMKRSTVNGYLPRRFFSAAGCLELLKERSAGTPS